MKVAVAFVVWGLMAPALGAEAVDADAWTSNASAETRPLVTPTATPWVFSESKAAVTPNPGFNVASVMNRWPHVDLAEAQRLHALKGTVFVDGRNHGEWQVSHIPGAVSLPVGEFDVRYDKSKRALKKAKLIVVYCHGENCRLADHLAQQLVGKGHQNVAVFSGGYPAWSKSGAPLIDQFGKPIPTPTFHVTPEP